jgi:FKBP-type peptidyl-prolyl cis-trans isomerase
MLVACQRKVGYNLYMKKLDTKEWVAVIVAVLVVGFFFIFGQTLVNLFTGNNSQTSGMAQTPQVQINDTLMGSGEIAEAGDRVIVHYTGKFTNGTVFDSSLSRNEPFQFVLGSGQVIQGWDEGIAGMREGGKRTLIVPPSLGYGMSDYGPIPGGSTLVFDVELLKVEKPQ